MHQPFPPPRTSDLSDRKSACAVALLTLAVYLTTTGLHFISHDEINVFVVARNLVGRGSFDADNIAWLGPSLMGPLPVAVVGVDGHSYAIKKSAPRSWLSLLCL